MTTTKPAKRTALFLVVLTLNALLLLPCLGAVGGIGFFALESAGRLSTWKSLGAPPDQPIEILASDTDAVYVATQAGRIYGCQHRGAQTRCWFSVDQLPKLDSRSRRNAPVFEGQVPSPPGAVVSQLQVTRWGAEFADETRYALLADGTLWKWEYSRIGLFALLGNMLVGSIVGVMIAVPVISVVWLIAAVVALVRAFRARRRAVP